MSTFIRIYNTTKVTSWKYINIIQGSIDVNIRCFVIGQEKVRAFITNIEGKTDRNVVDDCILGTLMKDFDNKLVNTPLSINRQAI